MHIRNLVDIYYDSSQFCDESGVNLYNYYYVDEFDLPDSDGEPLDLNVNYESVIVVNPDNTMIAVNPDNTMIVDDVDDDAADVDVADADDAVETRSNMDDEVETYEAFLKRIRPIIPNTNRYKRLYKIKHLEQLANMIDLSEAVLSCDMEKIIAWFDIEGNNFNTEVEYLRTVQGGCRRSRLTVTRILINNPNPNIIALFVEKGYFYSNKRFFQPDVDAETLCRCACYLMMYTGIYYDHAMLDNDFLDRYSVKGIVYLLKFIKRICPVYAAEFSDDYELFNGLLESAVGIIDVNSKHTYEYLKILLQDEWCNPCSHKIYSSMIFNINSFRLFINYCVKKNINLFELTYDAKFNYNFKKKCAKTTLCKRKFLLVFLEHTDAFPFHWDDVRLCVNLFLSHIPHDKLESYYNNLCQTSDGRYSLYYFLNAFSCSLPQTEKYIEEAFGAEVLYKYSQYLLR